MKKLRKILWLCVLAVAVLAAYFLLGQYYKGSNQNVVNQTSGRIQTTADIGGPYSLLDQDGKPVTDKTYVGKWQIVYFGFSYCPDVCPLGLQKISAVMEKFPTSMQARIQPIFITLDPERDTPEQLKKYMALFHPSVVGLTGTSEQVAAAAKAFKVFYQKVETAESSSYTVDHSSFTYLINPQGKLHSIFRYPLDVDEMVMILQKEMS